MAHVAQRLAEELSALSRDDRAELAHLLLESVADPSDSEAYRTEVARRVRAVETGEDAGYDAKEFVAHLRKKYS